MDLILFPIFCFILFGIELIYFRIAEYFNIIDQPNHRSSHVTITLRGGGVIFPLGILLYPVFFGGGYNYFIAGLLIISTISFVDDIQPVSNRLRILFHLIGTALMFYQLDLFSFSFYWIFLAVFLVIGSINAINFMDGINGMTGGYSLVTLCTLFYINTELVAFASPDLMIIAIAPVLVFNFFNFRKRAKCFAGDVGSISIAFIILFFLLQLIVKTGNLNYLLFLLLYGLDTSTTVFFRLIRKENIFDAHRSHFYQYLANERKVPQLIVSSAYALVQMAINLLIIFLMPQSVFAICISVLLSAAVLVFVRFFTEGSSKLFGG
jgi:UDP-GlcNAc:undecaprenyl-phosphate GlcNAc-1-phosphate transferase